MFPLPASIRQLNLAVTPPHVIRVEEAGNPAGLPVVLVHGGPGGPCNPHHMRFFDPRRYRIIAIHQRGAHGSRPLGELEDNTLDALVSDMETVRIALSINQWLVFGGSFGAAVALHYAQTHHRHCLGLLLFSVLTGHPGFELWDFDGSRTLYPESWRRMADTMPGDPDKPLAARCFDALLAGGPMAEAAMRAWYGHSATLSNVSHRCVSTGVTGYSHLEQMAAARLSAHFWRNRLFLPPGALLERSSAMAGLDCTIVHGALDHNCPVALAYALHARWPGSKLQVVADAGHSAFEPGMAEEILRWANERCRDLS